MAVIGFLEWSDFLKELKESKLPSPVVRVQAVTRGTDWIRWEIFVCALTEKDLLVARFTLGGLWAFELGLNDKEKKLEEKAQEVCKMLTKALQEEGFSVRAGLVAGCEEAKVTTNPIW